MIEAVNSAISSTQTVKSITEQAATTNTFAADIRAVEEVSNVALYLSPKVAVDSETGQPVLQIRDSSTGTVLSQFPTDNTLAQREFIDQTLAAIEANNRISVPVDSETAFQATVLSQEPATTLQVVETTTSGEAQAAVAALSAGAELGQSTGTVTVSITA